MKFSIGDKIRLLRTGEEGVVEDIHKDNTIIVYVDGCSFPVFKDEIDHPYLFWFQEKSKQKNTKPQFSGIIKSEKNPERKTPTGLWLRFIPEYLNDWTDEIIVRFKIYLVNEQEQKLKFAYEFYHPESKFEWQGELHPFQNIFLHTVDFEFIADQPEIFLSLNTDQELAPFETKLKSKKLVSYIHNMRMNNEPHFGLQIPIKSKELPSKKTAPLLKPKATQKMYLHELKSSMAHVHVPNYVDLHIEAITKNTKGLSNADLLMIQLDHCERYLQRAIKHQLSAVTIVHGIGNGVLRANIVSLLKSLPQVRKIDHDWDARFGFGATHVYF